MDQIEKILNQVSQGTDQPGHLTTLRKESRVCSCGTVFTAYIKVVDGEDKLDGLTICQDCRSKKDQEKRRDTKLTEVLKIKADLQVDWLIECKLPSLFWGKTFTNFERKLQPKAFAMLKEWDMSAGESIVLLSPDLYGVGKTHLVAALINHLIEIDEKAKVSTDGFSIQKYRCPVYFAVENTLLSRIRQTFNRTNKEDFTEFYEETEEDVYHELEKFDLLIIDDVGKVRPRDYSFLQGVYFRIIDSRYTTEKPIILTTNLSFTELENHIGGACADRLLEMAGKDGFIVMGGSSYRKKKLQK